MKVLVLWLSLACFVACEKELPKKHHADLFTGEIPDNMSDFIMNFRQKEEDVTRTGGSNWMSRQLQLTDACVEDGPYFYNLEVTLKPGGTIGDAEKCTRPMQVMLGHEINLLLVELGLGEREDGDDILAMGNLCPRPQEIDSSDSTHRSLRLQTGGRRKLFTGFVYRGGFSCGWFCWSDNRDARRLGAIEKNGADIYNRFLLNHDCNDPTNWLDCYINQVTTMLESQIRTSIAPSYVDCLGSDPFIDITMEPTTFVELMALPCVNHVESMDFLESVNLGDFHITTNAYVKCGTCRTLSFDESVSAESYVGASTWIAQHGVAVSASATFGGGYTPGGKPRVLNSNKVTSVASDLRSPNQSCPGGGPGTGSGGAVGSEGENCQKLGNVLIIQNRKQAEPEPNPNGGIITFEFVNGAVLVSDVGIIDADESGHRIKFQLTDGSWRTFAFTGYGNNGVQRVICNMKHVIKMVVDLRGPAAITELNYCDQCRSIKKTKDKTYMKQLVALEDFQNETPLSNWYGGSITQGGNKLTKFLGRYAQDSAAFPSKTYLVPPDADSFTVTLDLYQIDNWEGAKGKFEGDEIDVTLLDSQNLIQEVVHLSAIQDKREQVHLLNKADRYFAGTGENGKATFRADLIGEGQYGYLTGLDGLDAIWRVTIQVPGALFRNGSMKVEISASLTESMQDESFGVDNIRIEANYDCRNTDVLYFEDFEEGPLDGWSNGVMGASNADLKILYDPGFSHFLGDFGQSHSHVVAPVKHFRGLVPADAGSITVTYDLYLIDNRWEGEEPIGNTVASTYLRESISLRVQQLDVLDVGGILEGVTERGIAWEYKLDSKGRVGFAKAFDSIYKVRLEIPSSVLHEGYLYLSFKFYFMNNNQIGGIDNLKITGNYACEF